MTAPLARTPLRAEVARLLAQFPGVLLVGPRQVGKTTLARSFLAADHPNYFDLENPVAAAPLRNPLAVLARLAGLVVIDEVQHAPELFAVLRTLERGRPGALGRRQREHGAPPSRHPDLHGAPAPAVARQHWQAAGEGAQGATPGTALLPGLPGFDIDLSGLLA